MSTVRDDITISAPQMGKTLTGQVWMLGAMLSVGKHPAPWWWMAPTYAQCQHGYLGLCAMALEAGLMRAGAYTTRPPLKATLINGAKFEGRSWERAENMRGPTILGGVPDEFGLLNEETYGIISSRRAESVTWGYGWFRWIGNVGEVGGPAEMLWDRAESGEAGFAHRRWTWRDRAEAEPCTCGNADSPLTMENAKGVHDVTRCRRGVYMDFIVTEAGRMSASQFRQLYEAEWIDFNTLPAYEFDRNVHVADEHAEYQPELPVDLACDFNVDPLAWTLGQHRGDRAWAFDEISVEGQANTQRACEQFIDALPRHGISSDAHLMVYGDRSGNSRDTRSKTTDYQIIRQMLSPYFAQTTFDVQRANPPVSSRLNAVNAKFRSATGEVSYWMHSRCKNLANDFARVSLKPGTRDLNKTGAKNKHLTHFSDGEGYRLARLYPVGVADYGDLLASSAMSHDSYSSPIRTGDL